MHASICVNVETKEYQIFFCKKKATLILKFWNDTHADISFKLKAFSIYIVMLLSILNSSIHVLHKNMQNWLFAVCRNSADDTICDIFGCYVGFRCSEIFEGNVKDSYIFPISSPVIAKSNHRAMDIGNILTWENLQKIRNVEIKTNVLLSN